MLQKRSGRKERETSTDVQRHKNKTEKRRDKLVKRAKKSKSCDSSSQDPSSQGSDLVTCDRTQVDLAAKSQQVSKQMVLSTTCVPKKRKPNKRNKFRVYSHLALAAYKNDVSVATKPESVVTGSTADQNERTLNQTGEGKVTKTQPCEDLGSNSETSKKKKRRKAKKVISDAAKDCALETVTGGASSVSAKKRKAEARSTGDVSISSVSMATNRKRKCAPGDVKCSTRIEASTKIAVDKTSTNSPPANTCLKVKASTPSAATSEKRKVQCRFNIAKLKSVFQHQTPASTNTSDVSKDNVPRHVQEDAAPSKGDGNVPNKKKGSTPESLRERMQVGTQWIDR